jgi:transketolase
MTTATTTYGYDDVRPLMSRLTGDEKHDSAATSTVDVLWVLYDRVLRVSPAKIDDPDRDRFLLSKGHGPTGYYAVLAAKGFLPLDALTGFALFDSPLGHHPDRMLVPGVEISSGSLGHGLPIAVGMALGLRAAGRTGPRVVALVGDGELDEGSNWEAVAYAGRVGLDALTVAVVDNGTATHGWPGGLAPRFAQEGWWAQAVDGRDHGALERGLTRQRDGRPQVVVAQIGPGE